HEDQVVEYARSRHVVVHDLGHGEPEEREEDALGRVTQIVVLHWRTTHQRRGIDRVPPGGDRGDVYPGIRVRQRIEAGVIAEGTLQRERLRRIDVPLEHQFRLGGHVQLTGDRAGELNRITTQKAGEEELVDGGRQRSGS